MIIARNAIVPNAQDFLANDEFASTHPESIHSLHAIRKSCFFFFILCVIAEQSVCSSKTIFGSQQCSPVVRLIVNIPAPPQTRPPSAGIICALSSLPVHSVLSLGLVSKLLILLSKDAYEYRLGFLYVK